MKPSSVSNVFLLVLSQLELVSATSSVRPSDQQESSPDQPKYYILPPLREQADVQDAWTKERRAGIPKILRKYGVDAWLISQKEYAEETVFWSLKSAKQFSARRRTTTLFLANAIDGTPESYTWIDNTSKVWDELKDVLSKQNPASIAVDTHPQIAFSSGLHAGELDVIKDGIGEKWTSRLVSEPMVAVEYIATMPKSRAVWYRRLQSTAWAMISEAFSEKVITPGVTTTTDVEWWLREKIQQMNYTTWFHPDVTIIDENAWNLSAAESLSDIYFPQSTDNTTTPTTTTNNIIHPGDLLHVDFGVTALGLNTDTQHLAYVLPPSTTSVPASLLAGLKKANIAQDTVLAHLTRGASQTPPLTGNRILAQILTSLESKNITGKIYCHPIGDWGHAAGSLIGMTNLQDGVPVLGDIPLLKNMYYSIELLVEHFVGEKNATLRFPVEEDVMWVSDGDGDEGEEKGGWVWAYGHRQEKFHLVRTEGSEQSSEGSSGGSLNLGGDDRERREENDWRFNVQGGRGGLA